VAGQRIAGAAISRDAGGEGDGGERNEANGEIESTLFPANQARGEHRQQDLVF
jgi:hypothetical protein